MDRRKFLGQSALGTFLLARPWGNGLRAQGLQMERGAPTPEPVPEPHFPDRLHLFVWRNWELANTDRMAKVLGTTPEKVLEIGASMWVPFILLNVGCGGHVLLQVPNDFIPATAFSLVGLSGFIKVIALGWWGMELWNIIIFPGRIAGGTAACLASSGAR